MRVLPDNLKNLLKEPVGQLVDEKKLIDILKNEKFIVSIGDEVTYTILKNNINLNFCIVDYKTRRGAFPEKKSDLIKSFGNKVVKVKNPQGCITDELWDAIDNSLNDIRQNIKIRLEVEGEEDLASLVVIHLASRDVTIIYGLPNKGVLVVKPTEDMKKKVNNILNKM
jgi:hypothetical protein